MSTILEISDATTLTENKFKPRTVEAFRVGTVGRGMPQAKLFFLNDTEEEVLLMFNNEGHQLNLLLQRNTSFAVGNRAQLAQQGVDFIFDNKPGQPPVEWAFYKDLVKSDIKFDLQTTVPITGPYVEDPKRPNTDKLLFTAAVYYSENEAAGADGGQYVVLIEIGPPGSEDGGSICLFQGRLIEEADISFL